MSPLISTIIPTIGRPSLAKAVDSVLAEAQVAAEHELILVNDSGRPLDMSLDSRHVTVIATNRQHYIVARNTGAAVARGQYLHFLDDDDWMLPGWLGEFARLARQYPQASLLYGGCQIVNQHGDLLGEVNLGVSGNCAAHVLGGSWIQVGVAAIQTDAFFSAGGFNPAMLPGEETDLYRRLALTGEFTNSAVGVMCLLRETGWATTTPYEVAVKNHRASRELMLDAPAAWTRLRTSSTTPYWRGRNLKAYLASVIWNLRAHRWAVAFSRALYTGATVLAAGPALIDRDFWQALKDSQVPATADRAMAAGPH